MTKVWLADVMRAVAYMRRRMRRGWQIVSLMAVLCGLAACLKWPDTEISSKQPDKVLFERAMFAIGHNHFDVASLTLQTLVNTYPDSEYARKAEFVLEDPRIAKCGESWNSSPQCDGRLATTPPE